MNLAPEPHGSKDAPQVRVRLDLAYDGGPFNGWARQPGLPTVQGALEDGLERLIRRPIQLTVAGRTDTGVHARGQVAHFDLSADEWDGLSRGRDVEPAAALRRRIGGVLTRELADVGPAAQGAVVVRGARLAPEGFDARFSATWRRYSYRIADRPTSFDPLRREMTLWHGTELDVDALNRASAHTLGLHDFLSFCKPREHGTTIRELQRFDFERGDDGVIVATLVADAFCHHMVRSLIGAALQTGSGMRPGEWLRERLAARVRDSAVRMAPAHALVLEEIGYPDDAELAARATATRARRGE